MPYVNFALLLLLWLGVGLAFGAPAGRSLKLEAQKYKQRSETAARKSAPYRKLQQFSAGRKREAMQRDLAESLSYVKNLVVIGRGENMSAQLLLEELSELSKDLGPVFLSMARCIQLFDKETAARQLLRRGGGVAEHLVSLAAEVHHAVQNHVAQKAAADLLGKPPAGALGI